MATTSTAIWPGSTTLPGSGVIPGQGGQPFVRCKITFDDVSVAVPTWTDVTASLRGFDVEHGRESELSEFDAGNARVTLSNRDQAFDPNTHSYVRPLNRIWLYEEFSGEIHDLFRGYVEVWNQQWPDGGWSDAIVEVSASDEFKVLTLDALPTTSPPRSSYSELVQVDNPTGFWEFNQDPELNIQPPTDVEPNAPASQPTGWGGGSGSNVLPLLGNTRRARPASPRR